MVLGFNICIDGPELSEGVAAQLEGTIYKPRLGFAEELKLFFGAKTRWCLLLTVTSAQKSHQECNPLPN